MHTITNTRIGKKGEALAIEFLQKKSYKILFKNFYSNQGEIDIIALDVDELVFIEVKTRAKDLESALESMTPAKCKKIMLTAEYFLCRNPEYEDYFTRFDLLAVILNGDKPDIHHIKEAISF